MLQTTKYVKYCYSMYYKMSHVVTVYVTGATVSGELCPYYFETGECESGPECIYIHGEICKYCDLYCLPPNDVKMRKVSIKLFELQSLNQAKLG